MVVDCQDNVPNCEMPCIPTNAARSRSSWNSPAPSWRSSWPNRRAQSTLSRPSEGGFCHVTEPDAPGRPARQARSVASPDILPPSVRQSPIASNAISDHSRASASAAEVQGTGRPLPLLSGNDAPSSALLTRCGPTGARHIPHRTASVRSTSHRTVPCSSRRPCVRHRAGRAVRS